MKRFTETDKWRDSWFRKLKPMAKLAFLYVVDNCDAAGVWDPDYDLADFTMGDKVDWTAIKAELGERVTVMKDGKWYLTRFVEFQYGAELVPECRPHAKVLQLLKAHGIAYRKGIQRVSIPTGLDNTGKDKDRTGQDAGETPPEPPTPTVEEIYEEFPRKTARADALRAITKAVDRHSPEFIFKATQAYAKAVSGWLEHDRQYIPHPATWFNGDRFLDDPLTWVRQDPVAPRDSAPARNYSPLPKNLQ